MTSEEIIKILRSERRFQSNMPTRMAVVYYLYRKGYKASHIMDAFCMPYSSVKYYVNTVRDLLNCNDKIMVNMMKEVSTHVINLVPYFDREDKILKIRTYLLIDNNRL